MNKRIRELAEQAIIVVDNHNLIKEEELKKMYIPDCFSEKFAELIVRECMDLLEDFTTDIHLGGIEYAVVGASETLQEHFGIEE